MREQGSGGRGPSGGALDEATTVAVVAAMVPELRPLRRALGLQARDRDGLTVQEGSRRGRRIVAVVTSMGTASAARTTARLLDSDDVDHVLAVGIAGGVAPDLTIGELLVPAHVELEATGERLAHRPLEGGRGQGTLLTTDRLHNTAAAVDELRDRDVVAVDMETAAIAATAEARGVPWSVLRAVSDRAGDAVVDEELLAMTHPDGRADLAATARYLVRHPDRFGHLRTLGRGMRAAVSTITDATLAALDS